MGGNYEKTFQMFDSSWINNEIGVKGSLVTAEVRGLLDKQFTEGFSSAWACHYSCTETESFDKTYRNGNIINTSGLDIVLFERSTLMHQGFNESKKKI